MEDKREKLQVDVLETLTEGSPGGNGNDQIDLETLIDVSRYKKSWKDKIDSRFVSIFLISLFFNVILVLYLSHLPFEMTADYVRKIQEHYAQFIYETKPEPEQVAQAETSDMMGAEEAAKKPEKTDTGGGAGKDAAQAGGGGKADAREAAKARREAHKRTTQEIAQEVSNKGILGLLTGTGSAAQGEEVVDILSETSGGGSENLDEVLSEISGIKSSGKAGGGSGARSARGSRVVGGGGIGDMVDALTQAKTKDFGKKKQDLVVSQSSIQAEAGKSAGRNPEDVLAVINSHRAAIEYCYQRGLRRNPNLKGKISVRFIIRPDGSVKDVKIISSTLGDPSVERCIIAKIRSWRDFGPIDPSKGDAVFRQDYIFGY